MKSLTGDEPADEPSSSLAETPPGEAAARRAMGAGWAKKRTDRRRPGTYAEADRIASCSRAAGWEVRDKQDGSVEVVADQASELTCLAKSADVAQLAEQLICNQQVRGSIPLVSSSLKTSCSDWPRFPAPSVARPSAPQSCHCDPAGRCRSRPNPARPAIPDGSATPRSFLRR